MQSTFKSWAIALIGGLFFFYNFFQMTLFNPLAPALMVHFNIDSVAFGSVSSGYFLAVSLLALPAGMIADKIRTKPLMLALLAATVANLFFTASITDAGLLGMSRFAQGMIHAFALTLPMKLAVQWIAPNRLAMASSLIVTIGLIGGAVCQPIMTYFLGTDGLHQALVVNAYIGLAIFILFALVIRDNSQFWVQHHSPSWVDFFRGLKASMMNSQNWMGGLYVWFLNLPLILLGATWGQVYMQETWALKPESGSFIIGLIFLGVIVGGPLIGIISDMLKSRKRPLIAGSVLSVLVLGSLLLLPNLSPLALAIIFFLLGITTSSQVLVYPMVAESNPANAVAFSLSIVTFSMMLGNALASVAFSAIVNSRAIQTEIGPSYTADTFVPGMWMMWGAILLSLVVIAFMRETFKRSEVSI